MPNLWSGKRSEVDVLPLLRLGISNPYGPSSSAYQRSEKGGKNRKEISPGILEIVPSAAQSTGDV
jgi:hypothetical protein